MKKKLDPIFIEMFGYDSPQRTVEKKKTTLPDLPHLDTEDIDVKKASPGWFRPVVQIEHQQLLDALAPLDKAAEYKHLPGLQKVDEDAAFEQELVQVRKDSRRAFLRKRFDHYDQPSIKDKFNEVIQELADQKHLSGDALNAEFIRLIN